MLSGLRHSPFIPDDLASPRTLASER
eukprot:IDg1688t1